MRSELQIEAAVRGGDTYLRRCYYTKPFKVADISGRSANGLHLAIMTASPGILDGDDHNINIKLGEAAVLQLYTQAYQRIFTMQGGARQRFYVEMGRGSSLCYLPHPTVPHIHSVFDGASCIQLSDDCHLIWGEIITCGRKLSGEVFRCKYFQSTLEVYKGSRLLFKDVTVLQPEIIVPGVIGQWEGYTHQGAILLYGGRQDVNGLEDEIHNLVSAEENITAGISRTASGASLLRVLGQGGEQLHALFRKVASLAGGERKI